MLYGMAEEQAQLFAERGHRVRIYTPFGELIPGMAYLVRAAAGEHVERLVPAARLRHERVDRRPAGEAGGHRAREGEPAVTVG